MSRSFKKHCGGKICCGGRDKPWLIKKRRAYRRSIRLILKKQKLNPECEFLYPDFREIANL